MKAFLCTIAILYGVIFAGSNALKLGGAQTYAYQSAYGLKKLEKSESKIRHFHHENGRYPTSYEINCSNYEVAEPKREICFHTVFFELSDEVGHFNVIYKSLGVPFAGKPGAGLQREYTYNTKTDSFNYSHLDTYNEVVFWRRSKIFIGLLFIFLPMTYMHLAGRKDTTNPSARL